MECQTGNPRSAWQSLYFLQMANGFINNFSHPCIVHLFVWIYYNQLSHKPFVKVRAHESKVGAISN